MSTKPNLKKRQKYWGEPLDCSSSMQIELDNFRYKQFMNRQLKDNEQVSIFTFEKTDSNNKPSQNKIGIQYPIKDLKEYEFFQK